MKILVNLSLMVIKLTFQRKNVILLHKGRVEYVWQSIQRAITSCIRGK